MVAACSWVVFYLAHQVQKSIKGIFIILLWSTSSVLSASLLLYFCVSILFSKITGKNGSGLAYLLTLPLFAGVSRMDWVSCAGDINLPHDLPPTKKSSTIKSWPTFCNQYFWKFPIWNSCTDEKRWEIQMVKVFKWYPVIDLFDTFTGKLGHGD